MKKDLSLFSGNFLKRCGEQLVSLLFPDHCILCGKVMPYDEEIPLCAGCYNKHQVVGSFCPFCESKREKGGCCSSCFRKTESLIDVFALASYDKNWRYLVHQLKYKGKRSLGRSMGLLLGWELKKHNVCSPDYIIPIPLYKEKERERGFNHSALLAKYAAGVLGKPVKPLLRKKKSNLTQTALARSERFKNVKGVFSINAEKVAKGKVLLIDDVYSTGATMQEAALMLHDAGFTVYGAVICYNPLTEN